MSEESARNNISEPKIKTILGGYKVFWVDGQEQTLNIEFKHIKADSHGGITGEITVWWDIFSQDKPTLSSVRVNLLSERRRIDIAKRLQTIKDLGKPEYWNVIIEQACHLVVETFRAGDPGTLIEFPDLDEDDILKPQYILDPLILAGVPSVIFGDKGTNKTTLAITAAGCVYSNWFDNPFGFSLNGQGHKVGLLDYESSQQLTTYTGQRIRRGTGLPYFDLAYRHCHLPLADDIEAVAKFITDNSIEILFVDSLGAACGGDLMKPESAIRFFEALRQLNITSLIIAQNSKGDEGKKTIFGSTFFTYYARNIFELKRFGEFDEKIEQNVALINVENNYTTKHEPMGFHLTFHPSSITIERMNVNINQLKESANAQSKIMSCLNNARGPVAIKDIQVITGVSMDVLKVLLSKLKARNEVVNLERGYWGLVRHDL